MGTFGFSRPRVAGFVCWRHVPLASVPHPHLFFLTPRGSLVVVETLTLLLPPPLSEKPTAAAEMVSKPAVRIERATCRRGTGGSGQVLPLGADQRASSRVSLSRQRLGHADFFSEKFQLIRETPPGPPRAPVPAPAARAPLRPPPLPRFCSPALGAEAPETSAAECNNRFDSLETSSEKQTWPWRSSFSSVALWRD